MLQSVFVGKAQETYSALTPEQTLSYNTVKDAILKSYEMVPEAHRLKFRTWRRGEGKTHVEFSREMLLHFTRWCNAMGTDTYEKLHHLIALEHFKNSVSDSVATYVTEQKARTASEAAVLADEFVLIRKGGFANHCPLNDSHRGSSQRKPYFAMHQYSLLLALIVYFCCRWTLAGWALVETGFTFAYY